MTLYGTLALTVIAPARLVRDPDNRVALNPARVAAAFALRPGCAGRGSHDIGQARIAVFAYLLTQGIKRFPACITVSLRLGQPRAQGFDLGSQLRGPTPSIPLGRSYLSPVMRVSYVSP